METKMNTLLELLGNVSETIKTIDKRIENADVSSNQEIDSCINIVNKLIRDLDHTVEKLESLKS